MTPREVEIQHRTELSVTHTSLKVEVEVYLEHMYKDGRELAIKGIFSFVAVGEDNRPIPVLPGYA